MSRVASSSFTNGRRKTTLKPKHTTLFNMDGTMTTIEAVQPHPEAVEILRQVEHYFSEENLPSDAHLLYKTGGDGNGPVSIKHICGFKRMRKYKPMGAVREALRTSTMIEILDNKYLKRRRPLQSKILVTPKLDPAIQRVADILGANPHLTKNMLKPTGFEESFTEPPLDPEQEEKEKDIYDVNRSFWERIEHAVQMYRAKRKMHEGTAKVFNALMHFGGIDMNTSQFTGGLSEEDMEGMTKDEIAAFKAPYTVRKDVANSLVDEDDRWVVDFEAIAKAFLSCHYADFCYTQGAIKTTCNVMRNFYNYLLHHNVCAEYTDQILAAQKIVDQAETELVMLAKADSLLPGAFNTACSTLYGGAYSGLPAAKGDWVTADDYNVGWSDEDARAIFLTGLAAFATDEQLTRAEESTTFSTIWSETLGIEIVGLEPLTDDLKQLFEDQRLKDTVVPVLGRLFCKRWENPQAPPQDLPDNLPKGPDAFELIIDDETLKHCFVGLKLDGTIKQLDLGIYWLDQVETTYASFFTWLPNERIKQWKEPGPVKGWMKRAAEERKCGAVEAVQKLMTVDEEDEESDIELPD